jgi:hypothetical protein
VQGEEEATKYFTPELIARGLQVDEKVLNEVEATWDALRERYRLYLQSVKDQFPPGLRHIEDRYYLHDAKVQGMGLRQGQFVFVLQLDTPPCSLLTFRYDLVDEPHLDREALPEPARFKGALAEWQYDEIEKVEGQPPTWRQSILLSNGWEVTLHFRDLQVEELQALLPAPPNGAVALPAGAPPPRDPANRA